MLLQRGIAALCLTASFRPFLSREILPSNQFETLSYGHIVQELSALATNYPHLAQVYSAQERFGLPSPGACSKDGSVRCEQWVLHVSDHASFEADPERPEVFFSGCLHGDEQVGPTAVFETAKLMVYAAVCEANVMAKECEYEAFEAAPGSVSWLARLARTRSTVFMPMANSIGYYNTVRTENGLDPNRDFPYRQQPDKCMTTITARAVNEVWREHAFQLAVTFHGGMVAMAYEWGSKNHPHAKDSTGLWQDISPDHSAQEEVTAGLSRFAGAFKAEGRTFKAYPTGRMNELVYPVDGGMEDWAYAGSWDADVAVCKPSNTAEGYGAYPEDKTIYNSAMLRALNILVEASDSKHPSQSLLGSRKGLLDGAPSPENHTNGHVARNVRLSLMVVDLVQPYVEWKPFQVKREIDESGDDDGVGFVDADELKGVELEWTVGGAFQVNTTQLVWGAWPNNSKNLTPKGWEDLVSEACVLEGRHGVPQGGHSRWGGGEGVTGEEATIFRERFNFEGSSGGKGSGGWFGDRDGEGENAAFVVAVAVVDQAWAKNQALKTSPNVGPQSHFVNARTSEDWFEKNAGHVVRGRLQWLSSPIKVVKRQPPSGGSEGPIIHNADILIDTPKIMENGTAVGTGNEESQQNPEGGDGQKPPPPMVPAAGHDASVSGTSPALLEIDVEKGGHGPKAPPAALFGASVLILGGLLVCLVVRAVKKGQLFRGATAPNASKSSREGTPSGGIRTTNPSTRTVAGTAGNRKTSKKTAFGLSAALNLSRRRHQEGGNGSSSGRGSSRDALEKSSLLSPINEVP